MIEDNVFDFPKPAEFKAQLLALDDMPECEPLKPWYSGFPEWRNKMAFAPGTLSVCTGHPGNGKSTLMGNIWFNTASINDLGVVVATFETRPLPHYRKMLRQFWAGMPQSQMTDLQIAMADEFIREHYRFVVHPRERPNLTEIIELAAMAGHCQVVIIDPWNRLESQRNKNETETEYIAWCLSELRLFAVQYNCHVMIIAHPAKRDIKHRDDFPILEDISGSKHWDNLPDQGFCVHRPAFVDENGNRCWDAELHHLKSRFEELGYPCTFDLRLNPKTWRFETFNKPKKKPKRERVMAEFKEFQLENGEPVAVNIDNVIYCVPDGEGTRLIFAGDSAMNVQEPFKQVLKHLPQERTDSFGQRVF